MLRYLEWKKRYVMSLTSERTNGFSRQCSIRISTPHRCICALKCGDGVESGASPFGERPLPLPRKVLIFVDGNSAFWCTCIFFKHRLGTDLARYAELAEHDTN